MKKIISTLNSSFFERFRIFVVTDRNWNCKIFGYVVKKKNDKLEKRALQMSHCFCNNRIF